MTLATSGALSLSQINAEFGGNSLADYAGATWYTDDGGTGVFAATVAMTDFYSTRHDSPVVAGSRTFLTGGTITIAYYNTISFYLDAVIGGDCLAGSTGTPQTANYYGGVGGRCVSTFARGAAGAPGVLHTYTVSFTGGKVSINLSTVLNAFNGGSATCETWQYQGGDNGWVAIGGGGNGTSGSASGGNVANLSGGSQYPAGRCYIVWT